MLDFFAGSGTTGAVARQLGRRFVMIDNNPEAIAVIAQRLGENGIRYLGPTPSSRPPATASPGTRRVGDPVTP